MDQGNQGKKSGKIGIPIANRDARTP